MNDPSPSSAPSLSEDELDALAARVDAELTVLRAEETKLKWNDSAMSRGGRGENAVIAEAARPQIEAIETGTGESFESFWERFLRNAKKDLCLPGGVLHGQWKKWGGIESRAAVRSSCKVLALMGVSSGSIPAVAVAASVFLLHAAANIGIQTLCEERVKAAEREKGSAAPAPEKP